MINESDFNFTHGTVKTRNVFLLVGLFNCDLWFILKIVLA